MENCGLSGVLDGEEVGTFLYKSDAGSVRERDPPCGRGRVPESTYVPLIPSGCPKGR